MPETFAAEGRADSRRYLLHRFPFQIVYRARGETIEVVAVAHLKRRPGYWKSR
jgi:toxin ParE1/3/4